jgi:photosystem II stability/assembly factor-like uncharacterized protein/long-subunit fatty acid transport protein
MRRLKAFTIIMTVLTLWLILSPFIDTAAAQTVKEWTNLGLYGGWVYDIAVDPSQPGRMFAGTYMGDGLFKTDDGGRSWDIVEMESYLEGEDTFKDHAVYAVKISPTDTNIIWVAHNYWVAKSIDGGSTWQHIQNRDMQRDCPGCGGSSDNFRFCRSLAIDPNDARIVYVGTSGPYGSYPNGAVYKTVDGGKTWRKMNQGENLDNTVVDMAVDPENPNVIWAVTSSSGANGVYTGTLYRSANGGETWSAIFPLDAGFAAVTVKPDDSNTVFTGSAYGVIRHYFDGSAWQYQWPVVSDECRLAEDIVFDPQLPNVVYAVWKNTFFGDFLPKISRSTDGGYTWETYIIDSKVATKLNTIAVDTVDSNNLIAGDAGLGIIKSLDNGLSWTPANDGINAVIVYDVIVDPKAKEHLLAGTISGLYEKTVNGEWQRLTNEGTRAIAFHPFDSAIIYAGIYGAVMKSVDAGNTWSMTPIDRGNVFDIEIDPVMPDTMIFVAQELALYRSTDGGDSYAKILAGENRAGESYSMNAVTIDPSDHRHVYAGGGNFYAPKVEGDLWESFDGGDSWRRTGLTDVIVNDVLVDPTDPNVLYAGCGYSGGTEHPIYKSLDKGRTWTAMSGGIPPLTIPTYSIWGFSSKSVYTVGFGNVQQYDGSTWNEILTDPDLEFTDLWGSSEEQLYAVGSSGVIWRFNGTSWAPMKSGTDQRLRSVWGTTDGANVYAVGYGGTILYFNGVTWSSLDSGTTENLFGIWGSTANDLFVVGDKGTVLRNDGSGWALMSSGTSQDLHGVWGTAPDKVFAVGDNGTIIFYDGGSWTPMSSGTTVFLDDVWGSSTTDVYAVGERGTLLHYNGISWEPITVDTNQPLSGIWGSSSADVFVVSDRGGILNFNGQNWTLQREFRENNQAVVDLEFHSQNPDIVYAGTYDQGVYVSPNKAGHWLNLGNPGHTVFAISIGSLYAATQAGLLQCTGTGVIAGRLHDAVTQGEIDGATLYNDLGVKTRSIKGEYMMVSPVGTCTVTAVADQHANQLATNVQVYGGDVTWVNLAMESGVAGPVENDNYSSSSSGGSYSCFIDTAESFCSSIRLSWSIFLVAWLVVLCIGIQAFSTGRREKTKSYRCFLLICLSLSLLMALNKDAVAGTLFQQVGIASSPNPVGSGARALGMGGAFIGVADDATAASWNPAGLIQLEKPEVTVVGEYVKRSEEFSSSRRPEINNTGEIDTTNLNYLAATLPFHFYRNIVVSLNYQRLYDFKREFAHQLNFTEAGLDLTQNKQFKQDGSVGALGVAGAIEITPTLSLGATLNIWTDQLCWSNGWDETFTENSSGTIGGVAASSDTYIKDEYSQFRGLNANIGLMWNVIPSLTIGAVFKTPFTASLQHNFTFQQTQTLGPPVSTVTTNQQIISEGVDLDVPLSYGIGLAWRISDSLTIDADIYRTQWSEYILEDSRGNKFSPITGLPENLSDVDDTTQIRIGAEYLFIFPNRRLVVPLRIGAFYDPEPSQGEVKDFYGIAIGSGLAYKRLIFDLAYNFRWGNDVDTGNLITSSTANVHQQSILASLIIHL